MNGGSERISGDPGAGITVSPYRILSIAALLGMVCVVLSTWVALHQPWLGVDLRLDEGQPGVVVEGVHEGSPADLILTPGDAIISIRSTSGFPYTFETADLVEDPDVFPTFREYNLFLERQEIVAGILREPVVELNLADGRKIRLQPAAARPWSSMPLESWLLNAMGVTIFLISAAVWSVRRRNTAVRMFLFSGVGLLITGTSLAIIVSKEIAFDPVLTWTLREIYHAGNN
ncbi:MAG: PDZ domain-containing protein, partial [Thermovirgaceae bacterium]|nr:PDZ domain-containing protein [Thermovirgaceae bacterium]